MKIHISPLLIPLAAAAVLTHTTNLIAMSYACISAHELAHLFAALCIGLSPESVELSPFGARLRLKNKIVCSAADEIILYSAGPLLNGVSALVFLFAGCRELYRINLVLMIMNLLPVMPLDGGVLLKRILSYRLGARSAAWLCGAASAVGGVAFLCLAAASYAMGDINISMFVMAVFLLGNAVTGKELYSVEWIKGISGIKRTNRAKLFLIENRKDAIAAIKAISTAYTTLGVVTERDGTLRLVHERDLIEQYSSLFGSE